MYEIIATEDFINLLKEVPLKYVAFLNRSFIRVRKIEDTNITTDCFMKDLIEQIRNQELEWKENENVIFAK